MAVDLFWENSICVQCRTSTLVLYRTCFVGMWHLRFWQPWTLILLTSFIVWQIAPCRNLPPAFTLVSCVAFSSTLRMEATCSSETSVDFQRTPGQSFPKDITHHNHRCKKFKSYINITGSYLVWHRVVWHIGTCVPDYMASHFSSNLLFLALMFLFSAELLMSCEVSC
jgi:hypothetical protein